jgi:hypothetical protein
MMKLNLIEDWQLAYKYLTVKLAALLALVAAAWDYIPVMREYLDPSWLKWFALAMIVSRVISQPGIKQDDADQH